MGVMRNTGGMIGPSIITDQMEADHQSWWNIGRQKKLEWALNSFEKKLILYTQSYRLTILGSSLTSFDIVFTNKIVTMCLTTNCLSQPKSLFSVESIVECVKFPDNFFTLSLYVVAQFGPLFV